MKPSRIFIIAMLGVLALLQYKLWVSPSGIMQVWHLKQQISQMGIDNNELQLRNAHVAADVENLKEGSDAIEEHARDDLGLVRSSEVFYQIVE